MRHYLSWKQNVRWSISLINLALAVLGLQLKAENSNFPFKRTISATIFYFVVVVVGLHDDVRNPHVCLPTRTDIRLSERISGTTEWMWIEMPSQTQHNSVCKKATDLNLHSTAEFYQQYTLNYVSANLKHKSSANKRPSESQPTTVISFLRTERQRLSSLLGNGNLFIYRRPLLSAECRRLVPSTLRA